MGMNTERPTGAGRNAAVLIAVMVALLSHPASAAEVAMLRNGFTIRHEHRLIVGDNTRLFFDGDNASFIDVPTADIEGYEKELTPPPAKPVLPPPTATTASTTLPPALDLNQVVNSASAAYHLDPDLVNSVIHAESGFNAHAVSRKGAQGLMQLMPDTASKLGVANAFDPQANVAGGSRYLRELLERYNFDLIKALAAYNAGPQRVEQYKGVPPYRETHDYVARIVREYNRKKIAQEKQAAAEQAKEKAASQHATSASASQPQR
jgi:soluble lytic murein transglycosylase-like protein